MGTLRWGHSAEEEEVAAVAGTDGEGVRVDPVMDDPGDREVGRVAALRVGDRDDGDPGGDALVDVGELVVERAMDRRHDRQVRVPLGVDRSEHGVVVDDVEALGGVVGGHHVAQLGDGDPDAKSFGLVEDPLGRY